MTTERDRSSDNRDQEPGSAEEPQRAGTSSWAWSDRAAPSWSVPPGLIAPRVAVPDAERPDITPAEAEPASDDDDFPGAARPAGWFLNSPAGRPADHPQAADLEENVTGEWFASPAPEPGESPLSWDEDTEDPDPDAVPSAPRSEEPIQPASAVTEPPASPVNVASNASAPSNGNGSAPAGPGPG